MLSMILVGISPLAGEEGDEVKGLWWTEDEGAIVEIYREDGAYYGKLKWLEDPYDEDGNPLTDDENPDEEKRDRPLKGLEILKDLEYNGDKQWSDGEIYDPENGTTYSCRMQLEDGELHVRGYYGISALGRTQVWEPAEETPE